MKKPCPLEGSQQARKFQRRLKREKQMDKLFQAEGIGRAKVSRAKNKKAGRRKKI